MTAVISDLHTQRDAIAGGLCVVFLGMPTCVLRDWWKIGFFVWLDTMMKEKDRASMSLREYLESIYKWVFFEDGEELSFGR